MNKVILIGILTKDPELTTTTNGISVCKFSIAVNRRFANTNGEREADFFNIVVWRGAGENCNKYLKKGSKCGITGQIQNRQYDGADGTKKYYTEIVADEVEFLNTKNSNGEGDSFTKPETKSEVADLEPIEDDTLPF